jgi:Ca2+-binding RTX toxin-like protein
MTTTINSPKDGSTTFTFGSEPDDVNINDPSNSYTLYLKGGNDKARGSGGNDSIFGGTGFDELSGGFGDDFLKTGQSKEGEQDQNDLLGDQELIGVGVAGGNDRLLGGKGNLDRLVGDSEELYGQGGRDELKAFGIYTQLVGDATAMKPYSKGGDDILVGTPTTGTRTLMHGDAVNVYGPVQGGNDSLISGQSDDFMYGDWEYTFNADFANEPYIFDIYYQFAFFSPASQGPQEFTFKPVTFELIQQNFDQESGGPAPTAGPNDTVISFQGLGKLANQYNISYETGSITTKDYTKDITYVIPDRSTDPLAPKGGADFFIFDTFQEGNDVIFDFHASEGDRIWFRNGLTAADQGNGFFVFENGRDTFIRYGDSSILLPNTTGLTIDDFLFGDQGATTGLSVPSGFTPVTLA